MSWPREPDGWSLPLQYPRSSGNTRIDKNNLILRRFSDNLEANTYIQHINIYLFSGLLLRLHYADQIFMNYLGTFSQILAYVFAAGVTIWIGRTAISYFVFSRKKEQINKLEARISVLKLHLKGKVVKKRTKIEDVFRGDSASLEDIKPALTVLAEIKFNTPTDYQLFITNLQQINDQVGNYIKLKHRSLRDASRISTNKNTPAVLTAEEQIHQNCKKLVRYDKAHILIITQIIEATDEMIFKINEYNALVDYDKKQKKITHIPSKIEIENFALLVSLLREGDIVGESEDDEASKALSDAA